jgi:hypothetical protein
MSHKKSNHERYRDWWKKRTLAEKELQALAFKYEENYFSDLRLTAPSIRKRVLQFERQLPDGTWTICEDECEVTIMKWIFKLRRSTKFEGQCNWKQRTIYISTGLTDIEYQAALLHELIHAYESQLPHTFREWLVLDLHSRMTKLVRPRRLSHYVNISTHSLVHEQSHGVLFLLKSLDLDLRFGWKFGTVFGYGRAEYLAQTR